MINWIKSLFNRKKLIDKALVDVDKLRCELETIKKVPIFTTIRTFRTEEEFGGLWQWVKSTIMTDEYKFIMFILRENTIREMVGVTEAIKIQELNARLNMLAIIDRYLSTEVEQHEIKVFGTEKSAAGAAGLS